MITEKSDLAIDITQEVVVSAPIQQVYDGLLFRMAEGNKGPEDSAMPMVLERRPGGRWFRDLGEDAGHLWGHVQSIRPPTLLEIYGPLFISAPVSNNLLIRLTETDEGVSVVLKHTAHGPVQDGWADGVSEGWAKWLADVKTDCEAGA
ncbi:MAG: hypothetical protein ACI80V_001659 [Rhodothermales bacterium]|jgi:hypothetical protein